MPQPHSETERTISDGAGQLESPESCLQGRLGLCMGSMAAADHPAWSLGSAVARTSLHQQWLWHWVLGHSPAPATVAGEFWHTSPRFSFPPCFATVTSSLFFSFCIAFRVSLTVILKGISTFFFPIRIMKTVGAIVGHCSTSHTLCLIPVPGTPNHTTDAALITSPGQAVILLGWRKDMK